MGIKSRLVKLEGARGKRSGVEYVVDSWDDYDRVRSKLGGRPNVFFEMNKPEEERQSDPYTVLFSEGRLVETPRFKRIQASTNANSRLTSFIAKHLGGTGELPEF